MSCWSCCCATVRLNWPKMITSMKTPMMRYDDVGIHAEAHQQEKDGDRSQPTGGATAFQPRSRREAALLPDRPCSTVGPQGSLALSSPMVGTDSSNAGPSSDPCRPCNAYIPRSPRCVCRRQREAGGEKRDDEESSTHECGFLRCKGFPSSVMLLSTD